MSARSRPAKTQPASCCGHEPTTRKHRKTTYWPYLNPEWLEEDYLIQDDSLLVEITCRTHKFEGEARETERITTSLADVSIKLERFQRILERSTRFTEEDL